ncbi:MAG: DUF5615 family PIN-like protein [Candidatus Levybacteria bacterium]|nr:DUF5615 family PIN-like protein [Candidatus Levybacteria bacterium]
MSRKPHKHSLLLDEGVYSKNLLPRTNSRHNLKHIKLDLNKGGVLDREVYDIACKQKRLIVTYNVNHFKKLAERSEESGVIGVSQKLASEKLDKNLNALLSRSTRNSLYGKYTSLRGAKNR